LRAPLSLHIVYFVPGWLVEEHCGYHWKGRPCWGAFASQFQNIAEELYPLSECFAVRWESVILEDVGNALLGFLKSIAVGCLFEMAKFSDSLVAFRPPSLPSWQWIMSFLAYWVQLQCH